jgi:hypothetical protein
VTDLPGLPARILELARLCIRATLLRAEALSYADIAAELGLGSPQEAKKCAEVGFGLSLGGGPAGVREPRSPRDGSGPQSMQADCPVP